MNVSVFIETLNEEKNLTQCLRHTAWSDDIVVLDSYSSDKTLDIARDAGARIYQRKFDNRGNHWNWSVRNIEFKHPWVYHCDADETVTQELADEILAVTSDASRKEVAYQVRYKNMFMGKWIKHSTMYPVWIMRLWKPDKIRWERLVNCVPVVDGPVGYLQNHFHHFSFSKGLYAWIEKHNKYSTHEAEETIRDLEHARMDWRGLFSAEPAKRRVALKQLSFRMPCRPLLRFAYMYLARGGILDGKPGLTYCALVSIYEYMICCKVNEMRRQERGLPI